MIFRAAALRSSPRGARPPPAAEPLAADVRRGGDDRSAAALKIIAGLLDVPLDSLRQREAARRQRRLALTAALSAAGCVVFAAISVVVLRARAEAERESLTARRTADFMKSLFVVSDPSEARGNSVTAREVLDRGVRQVDTTAEERATGAGRPRDDPGRGVLQPRSLSGESRAVERCRPYAGACRRSWLHATASPIARAADAARRVPGSGAGARRRLPQPSGPVGDADSHVRMRIWAAFGDMYRSTDDAQARSEYFARLLALASHAKPDDPGMRIHALEGDRPGRSR